MTTGWVRRFDSIGSMEVLVLGLVVFAILGAWLRGAVASHDALATAGTVFCGVFVQAVPFLGLGVLVSGLIAVFVLARAAGAMAAPPR